MEYSEMLLQSARQNAAQILESADALQEMAISMDADFDTKRAAVTAAKTIRLNACRILATSDQTVESGDSTCVVIYPELLLIQLQALIDNRYVGVPDVHDLAMITVKAHEAYKSLCRKMTAPTHLSSMNHTIGTPKEAA